MPHEPHAKLSPRRTMATPLFVGGVLLAVLVAAWVRFDGLVDRDMWLDESCTFYWTHHLFDWPADGPDPWREPAHLPYFFLLRMWTDLVGETAWGLRGFSALVSCAGVAAIGLVGASIGNRRIGLIAAALAAVHPLHVYYGREARVYAIWSLAITLCVYLLYQSARRLRIGWWSAYVACALLAVLTHYYTLLWLPATAAVVLASVERKRCFRQWLIAHAALGIMLVPVAWYLILPTAMSGPKSWLHEQWLGYPPLLAVPKSMWALLPSGGYPYYLSRLASAAAWAPSVAGVGLGSIAQWTSAIVVALAAVFSTMGSFSRRWPPATGDHGCLLFVASLTVGFLLTAFGYACVAGGGYLVGRYDLAAWPSAVLVVAVLIDTTMRRAGCGERCGLWIATALLIVGAVVTLVGARAVPIKNNLSERARRIVSFVSGDDLVVSCTSYRWFMAYHWHNLGFTPEVISFPPGHDRQFCWDNPPAELEYPEQIAADVEEITARIVEELEAGRTVWLVQGYDEAGIRGPRWQVDQHFFAKLQQLNIDLQPRDEWAGLGQLLPKRVPSTGG